MLHCILLSQFISEAINIHPVKLLFDKSITAILPAINHVDVQPRHPAAILYFYILKY